MPPTRPVIVYPPSPTGGRRVRVGGEILGLARSMRDLAEFLRRAGLEDSDEVQLAASPLIDWRGAGPEEWGPGPGVAPELSTGPHSISQAAVRYCPADHDHGVPMYMVDLEIRVEDTLAELPGHARQEVMEVIASVLVRPDSWPAPGEGAASFGAQTWILFSAYDDGIDVYDVGWTGLA